MNLPTEIRGFSGYEARSWAFLSNFYPCQVTLDGAVYNSVEHAYQAAKTLNLRDREKFRYVGVDPKHAKRMGKTITLRHDWEDVKIDIMRDLLMQKFYPTTLRRKLISTFTAKLVEENYWHDCWWGVCNGKCKHGPHNPQGLNHLGQLLMEVREYYSTYSKQDTTKLDEKQPKF